MFHSIKFMTAFNWSSMKMCWRVCFWPNCILNSIFDQYSKNSKFLFFSCSLHFQVTIEKKNVIRKNCGLIYKNSLCLKFIVRVLCFSDLLSNTTKSSCWMYCLKLGLGTVQNNHVSRNFCPLRSLGIQSSLKIK